MSTHDEYHQFRARALGRSGAIEKVCGALCNTVVDCFRRMDEGDAVVGLPMMVDAVGSIRNASGDSDLEAYLFTLVVEAISPDDLPEDSGHDARA